MEYVPVQDSSVWVLLQMSAFSFSTWANCLHSLGQLLHIQNGKKKEFPEFYTKLLQESKEIISEENFKCKGMLLLSYKVKTTNLKCVKYINLIENTDMEMFSRGEKAQGQTVL